MAKSSQKYEVEKMVHMPKLKAEISVEKITQLSTPDLNDLCDATFAAIESGGGFGWLSPPPRETLERFWQGVLVMPERRRLFVGRLDGVIAGSVQLVFTPSNNEAQAHLAHLTTTFVSPWARGYGLARLMLESVEEEARQEGIKNLSLDVRETQKPAINLYKRMGYEHWGTQPNYAIVNQVPIKGYYFSKNLSPEID